LIVLGVIVLFILVTLAKTIRVVPQARAGVVERLGRYSRTLMPGLAIVIPFVDRIRQLQDMREQVVSFQPQPVIAGQPRRQHRFGQLLPDHRPEGGNVRDQRPGERVDLLTVTTLPT
jgi:hypothetical protein